MPLQAPRATIDFETRSACDIQRCGAWIYARHPSTMILCLAWKLPGQKDTSLWHAGYGDTPPSETGSTTLKELFIYIRGGGLVEAHNAFFERCIWYHLAIKALRFIRDELDGNAYIGAKGMGAPPIADSQWRCSAAKTSAMAWPRGLGEACAVARVDEADRKDKTGRSVMLELSKPRRIRKDDLHKAHTYYIHDAAKHQHLHRYCQKDVDAEHALSRATPDLNEFELRVWQADQRANWRGVCVDMELVDAAIDMDARVKEKLNAELFAITGVESGSKRAQVLAWLQANGVVLQDSSAPTLDWWMSRPEYKALTEDIQRVIRIARDSNKTSITKYARIKEMADPDDNRVRDLVKYHGAATGRWAGSGIQVQNFPRGDLPKWVTFDEAVQDVKDGDLMWCEAIYGDVLNLLSSVLRGALIAGPGRVFYVADYAAIEARIVLWLAGAEEALGVFRRGEDIYCAIASTIYGRPINKKEHPRERQLGKVTILGLGYGMGFVTFLLSLRGYKMKFSMDEVRSILGDKYNTYMLGIKKRYNPKPEYFIDRRTKKVDIKKYQNACATAKKEVSRLRQNREVPEEIIHELALCKYLVDVYRSMYPEVTALWKEFEAAATQAVMNWEAWKADPENVEKPKPIVTGKVYWIVEEDRFLRCYLPSGRALNYTDPWTTMVETPWGKMRPELHFWGVHKKTKKWSKMSTYGGSLVENVDQGAARDIMAWSFVTVDGDEVYDCITTIHDELLAEADAGTGGVEEFEGLLVALPPAFEGCPIAAEGGTFTRYRK
jgi:DNA polymerase